MNESIQIPNTRMSTQPDIAAKVEFLNQPGSYPFATTSVEVVETHMSWVFLTDDIVYKLKKPVRYEFLDFSTLAQRRANCHRELELNRRLAADVYLAVVPLTLQRDGTMRIDGEGMVIDWLVKMKRLPRDRMLDQAISDGTVTEKDIGDVGRLLAEFYQRSSSVDLSTADYRSQLKANIDQAARGLLEPSFGFREQLVRSIEEALGAFIATDGHQLDARVEAGRVIDAHGDLRPEHVCLTSPPVIFDCLEFNRELRLLDTASELSFLTMECEQLGAGWISQQLWETYRELTGDVVNDDLLNFYRGYHALTRAKIAIAHFRNTVVRSPEKWKPKAEKYLRLAATAIDV